MNPAASPAELPERPELRATDGSALPPGLYLYRVDSGAGSLSGKMTLVR